MTAVFIVVAVWLAFNVLVAVRFLRNSKDDDARSEDDEAVAPDASASSSEPSDKQYCEAA